MPVLLKGDSTMIIMPTTYSPSAVKRAFSVIHEFEMSGTAMAAIYNPSAPVAAIIRVDLEEFNGTPRHRVIAKLDLNRKLAVGDNVLAVERFWQDSEALQVEGIIVDPRQQFSGLATMLYELLVTECGITLASDNEHYEGGKALWQHIANQSEKLAVFVLDAEAGLFYPYNGQKLAYDGKGIPESAIWNEHPDKTHWGVILIAEDKRKIAALAA